MNPIIGCTAILMEMIEITSSIVALLTIPSAAMEISPPYLMNFVFITPQIMLEAVFIATGQSLWRLYA